MVYRFPIFFNKKNHNIKASNSREDEVFTLLNKINSVIKLPFNLNEISNLVLKEIINYTQADSSAIYLIGESNNILKKRASHGEYPFPELLDLSSNILCFKSNELEKDNIIIKNLKSANYDLNQIGFIKIKVFSEEIGLILICNIEKKLNNFDYELLKTLKKRIDSIFELFFKIIELIEKNEIEKEISIASSLSQKIKFNKIPENNRISFFLLSNSIKEINSDYINVIPISKEKFAIVIADVAGKGIDASIILLLLNAILKFSLKLTDKPSIILNIINKFLIETTSFENYATCFLLIINISTNEVYYSNSGHIPLLWYKNNEEIFSNIDIEGLPLGIDKESKYQQNKIQVKKDDILILTTDGFFEMKNENGESYSKSRLFEIVKNNSKLEVSEIGSKIKDDIELFLKNSKQKDDQSLIIIKIK